MANVCHVTACVGRTNYQASWFLLNRVYKLSVSCLSAQLEPISAKYGLGSWLKPSDEIRLYSIDTQRSCTE